MSKIYKLLKLYPGCLIKQGECVTLKNGTVYFPINGGNGIKRSHVEDFPDFWENVTDTKFEIISFKDGFGNVFTLKDKIYTNGEMSYGKDYAFEYLFIHAIRNNYTGEVIC